MYLYYKQLSCSTFSALIVILHNISADGLQKLKEEWLNGDEETRKFLEKKYGKATIHLAVEESFTNEWLKNYAKKCPGCGANIQVSNNKI